MNKANRQSEMLSCIFAGKQEKVFTSCSGTNRDNVICLKGTNCYSKKGHENCSKTIMQTSICQQPKVKKT